MRAKTELVVRQTMSKTSEKTGNLLAGTRLVVLREVTTGVEMGKRLVRSQVAVRRGDLPIGWITSFKDGKSNIVEPVAADPGESPNDQRSAGGEPEDVATGFIPRTRDSSPRKPLEGVEGAEQGGNEAEEAEYCLCC